MAFIEWSDTLSVGVTEFDNQHKRLIDIINKMHDSLSSGKTNDVIKEILDGLLDYTIEHFSAEENFFEKYKYSEITKHREQHNKLLKEVMDLKNRLENSDISLSYETMVFLQDWLTKHILECDMKYKEFFRSHGIS